MGTDWNQPRDTGPSATDWEDQRERLRPRKRCLCWLPMSGVKFVPVEINGKAFRN